MKAIVTEVESRLAVKPNKQEGIQMFDIDNAYPQRIRNAIKASGRTSQCVNIYSRFVRGTGFASPFYKTIVNRKGETIDKIHRKVVFDRVRFRGFALHFNFNLLGEIVEVNHIPFEECRLGIADEQSGVVSVIKHHPDWARETNKNFNKKLINEYAVFNPDPDVVMAQIEAAGGIGNYKGQMMYWSNNGLKYPEASCDPVLEDVVADHEASEFRLNNITTNFLASHILEIGEFETPDEEIKFKASLEKFQGAKRTSRILTLQRSGAEKSFNLEKVDIQDMDGLFKVTEDSVLDSIRRNYLIPAVLLSDLIAGKLGTGKEIEDAYAWMNSLTVDDRMIDEEIFTTIFSHWHDQSVNPDKNFSAGELRFGEERILVEKLQVGGTTAMKDVIVDPTLTPDQKKNILMLVFGLKEEDALKIIPTATPTPTPTA